MAAEERTQKPTPRRRQKAREKGQLARSNDLIAAIGLLAAGVALRISGPHLSGTLTAACRDTLANPRAIDFTLSGLQAAFRYWLAVGVSALAPLACAALAAGIIANLAQSALLISSHALIPDFSRINPVSGLKRLFSIRGLAETMKNCLKLLAIGTVAALVFRAHQARLVATGSMSLAAAVQVLSAIASELYFRCALALLLIGGIDYAYQRWEFEKSLRMTRKEVTDEAKESEGDPMVRSQRARRRRELLRQRISPEMAQATVVVTNPTHLAVALRYDGSLAPAPRVVAKGQLGLARRIVRLAHVHNIPIVQNIPVARALYKGTAVGDEIPAALYQAVAEILAAIYRAAARRRAARQALLSDGGPARPDL